MIDIDAIFKDMDCDKRRRLEKALESYRTSGDKSAKSEIISIIKEYGNDSAIRDFLKSL